MPDTAPEQVTLIADSLGVDGKSYKVLVDGQEVGSVQQVMVTHDRGPRTSPIVTSRTRSLRWARRPGSHWDVQETRWKAVEGLLRDKLGLSWDVAERLARAARVDH